MTDPTSTALLILVGGILALIGCAVIATMVAEAIWRRDMRDGRTWWDRR